MNIKERGFTLIELVIVIVILGILAAVAIPKFVDLSTEAKTSAVAGAAGAYSAAMAINYAACKAIGGTSAGRCVAVTNCNDLNAQVTDNSGATVSTGSANANCTVTIGAISQSFTGIPAP